MRNSESIKEIISRRAKDREKIQEAMKIQDTLRKKSDKNSTEIIREWRDSK